MPAPDGHGAPGIAGHPGEAPAEDPGAKRHHASAAGFVPPERATIDLHTHTLRSDGLLTPAELVAAAAAVGIRILAITDHDTLAGVRELRRDGSIPARLEVVPGIEINSVLGEERREIGEGEVHVLGLGVDPDDDDLEAALAQQRNARRVRFERMIGKLRALGLPVDAALETLPTTSDEDALGRPRIARAMIAAGYVSSVEEAFDLHLSRGRPAYEPRLGLGPIDAIRAIRASGGLPSLAHFAEAPEHLGFLRELVDAGLGGLEVHYRAYDVKTVRALRAIANDLRLVITGGSDYHGDGEAYDEAHAQLWFPSDLEGQLREGLGAARAAHV
ncbi:MAG TPA: PHP domain-containing protein [Candidatus Binatia bacterium]|nr:PHP domain-containing protein [Candidatus Binatia bacterium]